MSVQKFTDFFSNKPQLLFSAPGRTELGGNHTDHQHGHVLAAAVNMDARAWVAENGTDTVRVKSEGYPLCEIALTDLTARPNERNTTAALIRGVAAGFVQRGEKLRGFDAYCTSTVLPGSGLSSSAAFEVLLGTVINHLFCDARYTAVEVAQIAQMAENVYFGKPCGLMDQTASAVGGIVSIDFLDPKAPVVERIDFDFSACGYALCIIDTGADHADLTDAYAQIPAEMKSVAALFGKEVLRDVSEQEFYERIGEVRTACGDRATLRAIHFFEDDRRVIKQVQALKNGDFDVFLSLVNASGDSSWMLLQNIIPEGACTRQEVAFALTLAKQLLAGQGAVRIHGGGFAGTIQAFVPNEMTPQFCRCIESVLGKGSCHQLHVCQNGGVLLEELNEAIS